MVGEEVITRFIADNSQYLKGISENQSAMQKYSVFATNLLEKINKNSTKAADAINKMTKAALTGSEQIRLAELKLQTVQEKTLQMRLKATQQSATNYQMESRNSQSMFQHYTNLGAQLGFLVRQYLGLFAVFTSIKKTLETGLGFNQFKEESTMAFTVMMKSVEDAKSKMSELYAFAVKSPLTFRETVEASRQLMAYGFQAEELVGTMKMLGTVGKAVGASMQDMAYTYGTLRSQGRAYSRDLMQFGMRGIPIYDELAKVMDVDISKIQKLTEEGKVGAAEVEQAFKNMTAEGGRFGGMLDAYMETLSGKLSMLSDLFQKGAGQLTEKLFATVKSAVDELIAMLDTEEFASVMRDLGQDIGLLANGLIKLVETIVALRVPLTWFVSIWASLSISTTFVKWIAGLPLLLTKITNGLLLMAGAETIGAGATTTLTGAFTALTAAMKLNPYIFIATAILAIATIAIPAVIKGMDTYISKMKEAAKAGEKFGEEYIANQYIKTVKLDFGYMENGKYQNGVEKVNNDLILQSSYIEIIAKKYDLSEERVIEILRNEKLITDEKVKQLLQLNAYDDLEQKRLNRMISAATPTFYKNAAMPDIATWIAELTKLDTFDFTEAIFGKNEDKTSYIKEYKILGGKAAKLYIDTFINTMNADKQLAKVTGKALTDDEIKKSLETEAKALSNVYTESILSGKKIPQEFLDGIVQRLKTVNAELYKIEQIEIDKKETEKMLDEFDKYTKNYDKFLVESKDSKYESLKYERELSIKTAEEIFAKDKERLALVKGYIDEEFEYRKKKLIEEQVTTALFGTKEQITMMDKILELRKGEEGGITYGITSEDVQSNIDFLVSALDILGYMIVNTQNTISDVLADPAQYPGVNVEDLMGQITDWETLSSTIQTVLLPNLVDAKVETDAFAKSTEMLTLRWQAYSKHLADVAKALVQYSSETASLQKTVAKNKDLGFNPTELEKIAYDFNVQISDIDLGVGMWANITDPAKKESFKALLKAIYDFNVANIENTATLSHDSYLQDYQDKISLLNIGDDQSKVNEYNRDLEIQKLNADEKDVKMWIEKYRILSEYFDLNAELIKTNKETQDATTIRGLKSGISTIGITGEQLLNLQRASDLLEASFTYKDSPEALGLAIEKINKQYEYEIGKIEETREERIKGYADDMAAFKNSGNEKWKIENETTKKINDLRKWYSENYLDMDKDEKAKLFIWEAGQIRELSDLEKEAIDDRIAKENKETLAGYQLEYDKLALGEDELAIFDLELKYKLQTLQATIDLNNEKSAFAKIEYEWITKIGETERKNLEDQIKLTKAKALISGQGDQAYWDKIILRMASNLGMEMPSYAVGTDKVPENMVAQIHKGEMIIPAKEADSIRTLIKDTKYPITNDPQVAVNRALREKFYPKWNEENGLENYFNTELSKKEVQAYNIWTSEMAKKLGRDITGDTWNYDMMGYWKDIIAKGTSGLEVKSDGVLHFVDTYKKPNHQTFSDDSKYHSSEYAGGHWGEDWFRASLLNLNQWDSIKQYQEEYFNKYEPGVKLLLPDLTKWGYTSKELPSFAKGTNNVTQDMTAQIHKGEMIIPAKEAETLRNNQSSFMDAVTMENIFVMVTQDLEALANALKPTTEKVKANTNYLEFFGLQAWSKIGPGTEVGKVASGTNIWAVLGDAVMESASQFELFNKIIGMATNPVSTLVTTVLEIGSSMLDFGAVIESENELLIAGINRTMEELNSNIDYYTNQLNTSIDKNIQTWTDMYELGLITASEYQTKVSTEEKKRPTTGVTPPAVPTEQLGTTIETLQGQVDKGQQQVDFLSLQNTFLDLIKNAPWWALGLKAYRYRVNKADSISDFAPLIKELQDAKWWGPDGISANEMNIVGNKMQAEILAKGYAQGTGYVPQDMVTTVHKGEIIAPKTFSDSIRNGELSLGSPTTSSNNYNVTVNVGGSVTSENDLAVTISKAIQKQTVRGHV